MLRPEVEVFPGAEELAARFTDVLSGQVAYAVEHRSRALIAFSRPTPQDVFRAVDGATRLPRGRVEIFQVDERHVKVGDDERNQTLIERDMPRAIGAGEFHPVPATDSITDNVEEYDTLLRERCGDPPVLDFVHLGLGPDGHTASLVPGDPVLEVKDRWVATTKEAGGARRMTMTYPVLDAARLVVFLVLGGDKAEAVERVLRGDRSAPAARIENHNVLMLLGSGAAARL